MNRAFVKEPDEGAPAEGLPERQISEHPNYVTPAGLRQLEARVGELETRRLELLDEDDLAGELAYVDRDLRYYTARLESAILVDPARQPRRKVAFGAAVTVSLGYCLLRWVQRRRNPRLTRQIDASEVGRIRALRDVIHRHADVSGERIARGYAALPDADRDRIDASLADAQATLRRRGILRELVPGERRAQYRGQTAHRRLMVPGFLLLSQKVPSVWHPRSSVPRRPPAARWIVGEMEPEPVRRARTGAPRSS